MAKKIIINFTSNPVPGTLISPSAGFEYGIFINGTSIVYSSGWETAIVQFVPYGTVGYNPQYIVEVQPTLSQTISAIMALLQVRFSHPNIIYSIVNNTIEASLNIQEYTVVNFGSNNVNIDTSYQTIQDDFINLKYFFQYKNIVNDEYICRLYQKNHIGDATEIHGKAIVDKASVKDHLDVFRGGGLSLELEASLDLTLEDFYTEKEQDLSVRLYRNGALFFYGYINPEGLFQSYTRDKWIITLDCVDGLGSLSNLSFVDPVGYPFKGKMKAIDIVYYCLFRSGISLPINVSINTLYDGLTFSDTLDILNKIYLNGDRFQKLDNDTIMSCEEVLKSVLDLFCACIAQQNGEWYIYKPNELFSNAYVDFKRYNIDNVYTGNVLRNLNKSLGSNIDNFYPHHCSGNQSIQIKGSISKFRINYKYGFISGLLSNKNLIHDSNMNFNNWTKISAPSDIIINDPLDLTGLRMKSKSGGIYRLLVSDPVPLIIGDTFDLVASLSLTGTLSDFHFGVRIGSYFLKNDGSWSTTSGYVSVGMGELLNNNLTTFLDYTLSSQGVPIDGNLTVEILSLTSVLEQTYGEVISVDVISTINKNNILGEFHTVERAIRVSSNVKEVKTIYNGDNLGLLYYGSIFKEDQITPTETWSRNGRLESYPILRIAVEEELRISQKPLKEFKGSIYGYIPYLSIININNVGGKFMFIEYSYDTMTNIGTYKLLELFSSEIQDIIYKFTYDYGETVKPTITS